MIGFLLAFIVTLLEFIRGRHQNFMVFSDATQFFWQGISPYTTEFVEAHGRYFLYSPVSRYCSLRLRICLHGWDLSRGIYSIIRCSLWRSSRCPNNSPSSRNAVCSFSVTDLGQSLLSFQYNITVAYLFLFAYTLLEKTVDFWLFC